MLTSCCCFSLEAGGLWIGWLGILGSFLSAIVESFALLQLKQIHLEETQYELPPNSEFIMEIVVLVVLLFNLIISIMLVVGTVKKRHKFLLPWLIVSGIVIIFGVILNLYNIAIFFENRDFLNILIYGIVMSLQFYFYYVIFSLYERIRISQESTHSP